MNAHKKTESPRAAPVEVLRDGSLKASIWHNDTAGGMIYATTFARTYQANDGSWKDAHSFTGSELLRLAELARQAYAAVNTLRRGNAPEAEPEPQYDESLTDAYSNAL